MLFVVVVARLSLLLHLVAFVPTAAEGWASDVRLKSQVSLREFLWPKYMHRITLKLVSACLRFS